MGEGVEHDAEEGEPVKTGESGSEAFIVAAEVGEGDNRLFRRIHVFTG